MTSRAFLYCIKFDKSHHCKVGVTHTPKNRLSHFSGASPFSMFFQTLLEVESIEVASAWEGYILSKANRENACGEWVVYDDLLESLFAEISPAACCLGEFSQRHEGRPIASLTESEHSRRIYKAKLRSVVGPESAARQPLASTFDQHTRNIINARLDEGYGAEDVRVTDGIPEEFFWTVVREREAQRVAAV